MVIARLSLGLSFLGLRNFLKLCHDEKPCTWWLGEKGLQSLQSRLARMLHHEYDALKGYRFFGGGHIVLQRFVHVRCHFQPLPTKLVFAYFDRGSYIILTSFQSSFLATITQHRLGFVATWKHRLCLHTGFTILPLPTGSIWVIAHELGRKHFIAIVQILLMFIYFWGVCLLKSLPGWGR